MDRADLRERHERQRKHLWAGAVAAALWAGCFSLDLGFAQGQMAQNAQGIMSEVLPAGETAPVGNSEDAADDPAIWLHPTDPSQSRIIGTDKQGGLVLYDLAGTIVQIVPGFRPNNVDVRYGFALGGRTVDLVGTNNREDNTLWLFWMHPERGTLYRTGRAFPAGLEVYGYCLYRSAETGKFYVFVNAKSGEMRQFEIVDDASVVRLELVRSFHVGSQLEGCVADDENAILYVGEENIGIWRYGAEPDFENEDRKLVDLTGPRGHLTADLEGLTLYLSPSGGGYLIASSQGDSTFAIYERGRGNPFVGRFRIGRTSGIDAVSGTDGIAVSSAALGPKYPGGLFVAQDDLNDEGNQNFKLVAWPDIARAFLPPLDVTPAYDPRAGLNE